MPRPSSQYITFNFFTLFRSAHVFSSACCLRCRRTLSDAVCRTFKHDHFLLIFFFIVLFDFVVLPLSSSFSTARWWWRRRLRFFHSHASQSQLNLVCASKTIHLIFYQSKRMKIIHIAGLCVNREAHAPCGIDEYKTNDELIEHESTISITFSTLAN